MSMITLLSVLYMMYVVLQSTGTVTLSVTDVNDNSPVCTVTSEALTLAETGNIDHYLLWKRV